MEEIFFLRDSVTGKYYRARSGELKCVRVEFADTEVFRSIRSAIGARTHVIKDFKRFGMLWRDNDDRNIGERDKLQYYGIEIVRLKIDPSKVEVI